MLIATNTKQALTTILKGLGKAFHLAYKPYNFTYCKVVSNSTLYVCPIDIVGP